MVRAHRIGGNTQWHCKPHLKQDQIALRKCCSHCSRVGRLSLLVTTGLDK
ncbi:Hypothetical protein FNO222_1616 [Francisella orientalis]|uniref:Uncharacterized protein n=1 Tax=Francisella orientalis TaxID=299583 RepID=A0ABM5U7K4_9GAMM|nr:hypothetical protein FNO12_1601 [Francisella orientalis FNO12]AKN87672.1 Hypothetical protein FNO24_1603 [Francisella orientalis FNO24]AKN89210.1 Hypothetical protein FNO190_1601 [Francisella orientalis]AKU05969.1 Hypothetical protein FNO01_1601 [Francisella orientalis]QEN20887.1 Hypothetical protein FNO39_1616 [Francisella orientalis]